ncbi:MAG: (Fe-S)-binding protein [Congregibacter sp.]
MHSASESADPHNPRDQGNRGAANKGPSKDASILSSNAPPKVALFVTCLADLMRPSVAQASLRLLTAAGCEVSVPKSQTCCGQPGYNNGDYRNARSIARQTIELFEPFDYTVLPSGSCAGMLVQHYPKLLSGDWQKRAQTLAARVFELTRFLNEICNYSPAMASHAEDTNGVSYAYHDSCAGLRELNIREQPRHLLSKAGIVVQELEQRDVCCGFGGTFCAKMPSISAKMADDKLADLEGTGAKTLVGGDLGCLLALEGRASRRRLPLEFLHVAELLADGLDVALTDSVDKS